MHATPGLFFFAEWCIYCLRRRWLAATRLTPALGLTSTPVRLACKRRELLVRIQLSNKRSFKNGLFTPTKPLPPFSGKGSVGAGDIAGGLIFFFFCHGRNIQSTQPYAALDTQAYFPFLSASPHFKKKKFKRKKELDFFFSYGLHLTFFFFNLFLPRSVPSFCTWDFSSLPFHCLVSQRLRSRRVCGRVAVVVGLALLPLCGVPRSPLLPAVENLRNRRRHFYGPTSKANQNGFSQRVKRSEERLKPICRRSKLAATFETSRKSVGADLLPSFM